MNKKNAKRLMEHLGNITEGAASLLGHLGFTEARSKLIFLPLGMLHSICCYSYTRDILTNNQEGSLLVMPYIITLEIAVGLLSNSNWAFNKIQPQVARFVQTRLLSYLLHNKEQVGDMHKKLTDAITNKICPQHSSFSKEFWFGSFTEVAPALSLCRLFFSFSGEDTKNKIISSMLEELAKPLYHAYCIFGSLYGICSSSQSAYLNLFQIIESTLYITNNVMSSRAELQKDLNPTTGHNYVNHVATNGQNDVEANGADHRDVDEKGVDCLGFADDQCNSNHHDIYKGSGL
ncbi:hypothetical protein Cyrtocomes_00982 [Candidatus Cyrtobacter comes]|uniref:Uncharacterized protein n=1 Tax=Candidatus Cyrtobacter comes TaxID=675776 RepID=A0ABU5L969_9RICK|nr:hypothetical protein [Candidatus Cyrtobacter comes]MDZ5762592.1 hypothetical protein [Candidatus Cyrtobacter comes]